MAFCYKLKLLGNCLHQENILINISILWGEYPLQNVILIREKCHSENPCFNYFKAIF